MVACWRKRNAASWDNSAVREHEQLWQVSAVPDVPSAEPLIL